MRWRDRRSDWSRPKRPKARKLAKDEQQKLLEKFQKEAQQSPVLSALGCRITAARGRFYVDRAADDAEEKWGRITPLETRGQYLLERERRENQWYEVAKGGPKKLVNAIAGDTQGTFHGLGAVDASLRGSRSGPSRQEVKQKGKGFVYAGGRRCSTQEALFHYFGIPIPVLVEPRAWYIRHREPKIVEHAADRSRVLVAFRSSSFSGEPIVGTCLYLRHDAEPEHADEPEAGEPEWGAYAIRPNASESIATAEAWIRKRKWVPWC